MCMSNYTTFLYVMSLIKYGTKMISMLTFLLFTQCHHNSNKIFCKVLRIWLIYLSWSIHTWVSPNSTRYTTHSQLTVIHQKIEAWHMWVSGLSTDHRNHSNLLVIAKSTVHHSFVTKYIIIYIILFPSKERNVWTIVLSSVHALSMYEILILTDRHAIQISPL